MILLSLPAGLVPARHWKEASAIVEEIAVGHKGLRVSNLSYSGAYNRLEAQRSVTDWTCRLLSRPGTPDNSLPLRLWPACASTASLSTNRGKEFHSIHARHVLETDRSSACYGHTSTLFRRLV